MVEKFQQFHDKAGQLFLKKKSAWYTLNLVPKLRFLYANYAAVSLNYKYLLNKIMLIIRHILVGNICNLL